MHRTESVPKNSTQKVLWAFAGKKKTHHQIPVSRLDLVLVNKKKSKPVPVEHRAKVKESKS